MVRGTCAVGIADGPRDPSTERRPARSCVDALWRSQSTLRIDPDELALDPDVGIEHRRVGLVGRLETNASLLAEEPLEGHGVLLYLGHHDVAVAGGLLGTDDHEVPIRYVGVHHGVAPDPEHIRIPARCQELRHRHRLVDLLVRLDRATGSDLADDRQGVDLRVARLGHELASEPCVERGRRRQAQGARASRAALEVAIALQR